MDNKIEESINNIIVKLIDNGIDNLMNDNRCQPVNNHTEKQ